MLSLSCVKKLKEFGFSFDDTEDFDRIETNPDEMARIWLFLLQKTDPKLELRFTPENKVPSLCFYGTDKQEMCIRDSDISDADTTGHYWKVQKQQSVI